jgi:hypothetical protein
MTDDPTHNSIGRQRQCPPENTYDDPEYLRACIYQFLEHRISEKLQQRMEEYIDSAPVLTPCGVARVESRTELRLASTFDTSMTETDLRFLGEMRISLCQSESRSHRSTTTSRD